MDKSILSLCLVNVLWHKYRKTYVDNFVPLTKTPVPQRDKRSTDYPDYPDKNSEISGQYDSARSVVKSPFLGIHDGTAYALLYNGILGDKALCRRECLDTSNAQLHHA
ncbi:MAG: hypothetical protein LBG05_06220 [Treponema sp.]|jgi:hypothetical protein|nr:hypothetical protein [Treponema sp.]